MRVLFVASECAPVVKTGGLADVVGALPQALAPLGVEARVLMPAYAGVLERLQGAEVVAQLPDLFHGPASIVEGRSAHGGVLWAVDAPHLFADSAHPYQLAGGGDRADNHLRFGALGSVAAAVARGAVERWRPQLLHLHDWQAGLAAAYLKLRAEAPPPLVFTIHNMAYQGVFPAAARHELGLDPSGFQVEGYEFHGGVGFLKAGLYYADHLTTVSPSYAQELMDPDYAFGFEGLLASRREVFSGILNGIDLAVWDPETDPALPAHYSRRRPSGKKRCKATLEQEFGLAPAPDRPLFAVISRLTHQKGLDLLLGVLPRLLARGGRLALLGSGEARLEEGFRQAAAAHPEAVGVRFGYDEPLAHRIQAGADAIVVPSRFEPCGLTQLCALRYGTLPVVARTGGLADTVIDANHAALAAGCATGVQFWPATEAALGQALERVLRLYESPDQWRRMQRNALAQPVGWDQSAGAYAALYETLLTGALRP